MNKTLRKSRCGFVIIKLKIEGEVYFLMREDSDWKDINFIGGHEEKRDRGLIGAARRELLEEIPVLRPVKSFELMPLTSEINHGPVLSLSAKCQVDYVLQFFLLRLMANTELLFEGVSKRSPNLFVSEKDLLLGDFYRVSSLVNVLDKTLSDGLSSIPYSWPEDLGQTLHDDKLSWKRQLRFTV